MSSPPVDPREVEMLDQLLDLEQRPPRGDKDPNDVQVRLLDDQGTLVWTRFGDRKPGQLERTLAYYGKDQPAPAGDSKPKPPDPAPVPEPRAPDAPQTLPRRPGWVLWAGVAVLAIGFAAQHWVGGSHPVNGPPVVPVAAPAPTDAKGSAEVERESSPYPYAA